MSINKVDTYSEQHRNSCEARHMLTLPLAQRRKELELIEKQRGTKAVEYLKEEILKQHKYKKEYTKLT
jgi:hypothetical protein